MKRIFIDAMNLLRTSPSLLKLEEKEGNKTAKKELLRLLVIHAERSGAEKDWIVVFDGSAATHDAEKIGPLTCVYSGARTADEIIVEAASDAVALGIETVIISSDAGVHSAGAKKIRAEEFYDDLIRKAPPPPVVPDERATAAGLLRELIRKKHLEPSAADDDGLKAELATLLEYFSHGSLPPQKIAARVENLLRQKTRVTPTPDPQKEFFRTLKSFFAENAQNKPKGET